MLFLGGQGCGADCDGSVRGKEKKMFRVFIVRFDQVSRKIRPAFVFMFSTGVLTHAGPEQVIPIEGSLRIASTLAKVFDVLTLAMHVEIPFAVGTASAPHGF